MPKISGATITTWALGIVSVLPFLFLFFFFTGQAIALLTVIAREPLLRHMCGAVAQKCVVAAPVMVFNFGRRHIASDYHKLLKMLLIFMSQKPFPF